MRTQTQKTQDRAKADPVRSSRSSTPQFSHPVLKLQNQIGNQAVQRLLQAGHIQAKLTIGQPDDKYEQEADRVADQVMRMPDSQVASASNGVQPKNNALPTIQRMCPECEEELQRQPEEEELLQTKTMPGTLPTVSAETASAIQSLKGGGQPLNVIERSFFEPRFNKDFSQVRIHTDNRAHQAAQSVQARAFTLGRDIFFDRGEYSPDTKTGRRLLAHELVHTQQQAATKSTSAILLRTPYSFDDPIHRPIIEAYRRRRGLPPGGIDQFGNRVGPSDADIKYADLRDPPLSHDEVEQELHNELVRLGDGRESTLPSDYIREQLAEIRNNTDLRSAFDAVVQNAGNGHWDIQMGVIETQAFTVIQVLESQRRRLSDREYENLRRLSLRERTRRIANLSSPQSSVSGTGGWLSSNPETIREFSQVFDPLLAPLGLVVDNLLVLSSMLTDNNQAFRELPPRDLWPNMQQTLGFLAHLGTEAGVTFEILSAYRSDVVNALSGGASSSAHMDFFGLDVRPSDGRRFEAFIKFYWHRRGRRHNFGLGFYRRSRVHIDTKSFRRWEWDEGVTASRARYRRIFRNIPLPN